MRHLLFLTLLFSTIVCSLGAFEVVPEAIVFRGKPGQNLKKGVTLENETEEKVEVETGVSMEGTEIAVKGLKVSKKKFELGPGESLVVWVSCRIPDGKGEVLGSFVVRRRVKGRESIETRSSHRIYIQVEGTEVAKGEVGEVECFGKDGNLEVGAVFRNLGNVHLQPKLVVSMERDGGVKVAKIFESQLQTVMPGEGARYRTVVDGWGGMKSSGTVTGFFKDLKGDVESVKHTFVVNQGNER